MRRVNPWSDFNEDGWSPRDLYSLLRRIVGDVIGQQRPWISPTLTRAFGFRSGYSRGGGA